MVHIQQKWSSHFVVEGWKVRWISATGNHTVSFWITGFSTSISAVGWADDTTFLLAGPFLLNKDRPPARTPFLPVAGLLNLSVRSQWQHLSDVKTETWAAPVLSTCKPPMGFYFISMGPLCMPGKALLFALMNRLLHPFCSYFFDPKSYKPGYAKSPVRPLGTIQDSKRSRNG